MQAQMHSQTGRNDASSHPHYTSTAINELFLLTPIKRILPAVKYLLRTLDVWPCVLYLELKKRCAGSAVVYRVDVLICCSSTLCPKKSEPPNHFATVTANLQRFRWNFAHTRWHLFLSSTPSFIRIPCSVHEIFNSFKLLSQISVTDTTYFLADVICDFFTFQQDSAPAHCVCCATVSWDTRLHQPTGLAPEQSRSQSGAGGLCDLGHSAGCSRNESTAARFMTSTIWKNDLLKSSVILIRTVLTQQ